MNSASTTTARWAVSARGSGEVLTASVQSAPLELVLLGVPRGFTPAEIEGWLHDLAGVSAETSRGDTRIRAIPALLHHALTGLLFSQAELWGNAADGPPCAAAFVDAPEGASFGWVGDARVQILVGDRLYEPQWVRVRDEEGREARAAVLPPGAQALLTVEYWGGGDPSGAAVATIEADWMPQREAPAPSPASTAEHLGAPALDSAFALDAAQVAEPIVTLEAAAVVPLGVESVEPPDHVLPDSLPTHQPGLAPSGESRGFTDVRIDSLEAEIADAPSESFQVFAPPAQREPVVREVETVELEPEALAEAMARAEAQVGEPIESLEPADPIIDKPPAESLPAPAEAATVAHELEPEPERRERSSHPVGRWLSRLMGWTRPEAPPTLVRARGPATTPVSRYDALLSEPAPAEPPMAPASPALPSPHPTAERPSSPAPAMNVSTLAAAGLDDVFGRAAAAAKPENLASSTMPAYPILHVPTVEPSSGAFEVIHEPVGASDAFAIPPVPGLEPRAASSASAEPLEIEHYPARAMPVRLTAPVEPVEAATVDHADLALPHPVDRLFLQPIEPLPADRAARPVRMRPSWPNLEELREPVAWYRPRWVWAVFIVVLFGAGWIAGHVQNNPNDVQADASTRWLRAIGLGGARFRTQLETDPPGAWIAIDGRDLGRRTPATLELAPGEHLVAFSLVDFGGVRTTVRGRKGELVPVHAALWGSLAIETPDASIPVSVTVDGRPQGWLPVKLDPIAPGLHEVQFSGPTLAPWVQSATVNVRQASELVAHPMSSPATGVLQVQATVNDEQGSSPLSGVQVFVDGELKGTTPASLELPRGPHSLRATWRGLNAPIQVIDLPGGNQRFASFSFGLDDDEPRLSLVGSYHAVPMSGSTTMNVSLSQLRPSDVREAWLHVRSAEGLWRRYEMTVAKAPGGSVLSCVFPLTNFDAHGETRWYVSASTQQGDEYFTEMERTQGTPGRP